MGNISLFIQSSMNKAYRVKPVYKGHSSEHENVAFMSCCPFYAGSNIIYTIH